jgi:NADPH:quinone reductase
MRTVVVSPTSRVGFDFAEVAEPHVAEGQVLVAVAHAALNHDDLNDARSGGLVSAT